MGLVKYLLNQNSDTAVVFIHGLGGSYTTWKDFSLGLNKVWIDYSEVDAFALEYDVYYPENSFFFKNARGRNIEKLAEHLDSFVNSVCDKYKKIILICHSMGGLVARKYILNKLDKYKNTGKVKALITYATPHHGSKIANIALTLFRHPILFMSFGGLKLFEQHKDLSKNSEFLKSLNSQWSNLNVSSKVDFYRILGLSDWIVDEPSAKFEEGENVFKFANKNHFNIIKPDLNVNDNALFVTYNYLRKFNTRDVTREFDESGEYSEDNELDF